MKFRTNNLLLLLAAVDYSSAWSLCSPTVRLHNSHQSNSRSNRYSSSSSSSNNRRITMASSSNNNWEDHGSSLDFEAMRAEMTEFEYLLQETNDPQVLQQAQAHQKPSYGRRLLQTGDQKQLKQQQVQLASASTASLEQAEASAEAETATDGDDAYDPYAEVDYQQQMGKIQSFDQAPPSIEDRFKQMDLQDIIITLIIPGIVSFAGLRWGFNKVAGRVAEKADNTLDSFANEMVYHGGNLDELKMCHADYNRQLMWMGPRKNDAMIKRFLEAYAKKKTVSPEAIGTLSYVFTLFKLSEAKAAATLVSLCEEMGPDKISSAGKILFFGSRILKSPEGKQGLEPIKDMIKGTYRDEAVAETLVETSQQAMAEAAFRTTVLNAGKNQKKLTAGWEVLGLDKDTATRIFEEAAKEGFLSERETMYGGQTRKYDKKGNLLDDEGNLQDPDAALPDDDDGAGEPTSNVYECGSCGYTLFIAKGREFKFYGDDFECPECGAKKDEFQPANIEED